jgi:plasmid stabilization system protein ParE
MSWSSLTGTPRKPVGPWRSVGKRVSLQRSFKSQDDLPPAHPASSGQKSLQTRVAFLFSRFPKHLVFYQAGGGEILILWVVHGARDLESLFSEGEHSA